MPSVPAIETLVGNQNTKELIRQLAKSRKEQKLPFPHTLISGPAGTGKTTLARIIAEETGEQLLHITGQSNSRSDALRYQLRKLETATVVFIDEIHALSNKTTEELYYPMEEQCIVWAGEWSKIPPITVVGATTEPDKLLKPFKSRFPLTFRTDFYTLEELVLICSNYAKHLALTVDDSALALLAASAKGIPRTVKSLLELTRDIAGKAVIVSADVQRLLLLRDIGAFGLDGLDRAYLAYISDSGPVGIKTLSSVLGESELTLEKSVEPYLMRMGLVIKTTKGRVLTNAAISFLKSLPKML